jgi:lipid A 3-O-deacylase
VQKIIKIKFLIICGIFLQTSSLFAAEDVVQDRAKKQDNKGVFSVILENDIFTGTDRGYTNGIRFSYASSEEGMPALARQVANYLPLFSKDGKKRISIAAGQSIFTPSNIGSNASDSSDRPYAGWLYGSIGVVSDTGKILDNVFLTLGVVGPSAQAEEAQKFVHKVIGSPKPQGWNYQLKDEIGAVLTYERKWREIYKFSLLGLETDAMPQLGASLGNVNTDVSIGATFRLGFDLPSDYGPPRIRPSLPGSDFFVPNRKTAGYLFATFASRAVARNIFLDGNTFQESPHVHKKLIVNSLQLGAAVTCGDTRISYAHVFVTKEFVGQQGSASQFGAVTISHRF